MWFVVVFWEPSEAAEIWCCCCCCLIALLASPVDAAANWLGLGMVQSEPTGSLVWLQMSHPVGVEFMVGGECFPKSNSDEDDCEFSVE